MGPRRNNEAPRPAGSARVVNFSRFSPDGRTLVTGMGSGRHEADWLVDAKDVVLWDLG